MRSIVFFDIGATLIDGPNIQLASRIREALGKNISLDSISKIIFEKNFEEPAPLYHQLIEHSNVKTEKGFDALKKIWNNQIQEAVEIPGATACVQGFKQEGFTVGLISNIWRPYYLAFKRACPEILTLVDQEAIFLSYQQGVRKPNPLLYERAIQHLGISPCQAIMIGDSYEDDIQPALSLSMKAIWILRKPSKEVDSIVQILNQEAPRPDATVKSIAEINPSII